MEFKLNELYNFYDLPTYIQVKIHKKLSQFCIFAPDFTKIEIKYLGIQKTKYPDINLYGFVFVCPYLETFFTVLTPDSKRGVYHG